MADQPVRFKDNYTRKVSGEIFEYDAEYSAGANVVWSARVYLDGEQKGTLGGSITENRMDGEALRQYVIAYVESIIEKGLGIAE
jgi:hypothetical protein